MIDKTNRIPYTRNKSHSLLEERLFCIIQHNTIPIAFQVTKVLQSAADLGGCGLKVAWG